MPESPKSFDGQKILDALSSLLAALPEHTDGVSGADTSQRKKLRAEIQRTLVELGSFHDSLDPIRLPEFVLDPASPDVVGRLIADTLLEQNRHALGAVPMFYGSGVYALYYSGRFDAYQPIAKTETPIYVGKADPATHEAATPVEQGTRLWTRLNDHRRSIGAAQNLDLSDFECRYLVVKSAWQGTAETYLIDRFKPIWNNEVGICFGFGKHGDDPKTRANKRSPWDTLHPGRKWAWKEGNQDYDLTEDEIKSRITGHFRKNPPR